MALICVDFPILLFAGTSVLMRKEPHNQMYTPTTAQQQAGYTQMQQVNHGYHTRNATASQPPPGGVNGTAGGSSRW